MSHIKTVPPDESHNKCNRSCAGSGCTTGATSSAGCVASPVPACFSAATAASSSVRHIPCACWSYLGDAFHKA
eukprot:6252079-Amphidinium_carterae.1